MRKALSTGSRQPSTASAGEQVVSVTLARRPFVCVWLLVLTLRCVCATYLLTLSLLYAVLATSSLEYYARLLSPSAHALFPLGVGLAAFGAAMHLYQLFLVLYRSYCANRPTFARVTRKTSGRSRSLARRLCERTPQLRGAVAVFARVRFELLGRQGFFGVESPYFEARFLCREFVEMVSQTLQVYSASTLIAKAWINHLYVAAVVVNACSTPLVKRYTRDRNPALERLLCLAADVALDTAMAIALPLIILCPYYEAFDRRSYAFDIALLYNPSWFISLVMENRQVFARSHVDLVLKATPHLSIYGCLGSIQSLVRLKAAETPRRRTGAAQVQPKNSAVSLPPQIHALGPRTSAVVSSSKTASRIRRLSVRIRRMQRHKLQRRSAFAVHFVFVLWGLVVLGLHLTAVYRSLSRSHCDCKLELRPWFSRDCACSVFEYNCYVRNTTSPPADAFASLDHTRLLVLVFAHCPALVVPRAITQFPQLVGVEVWNATFVEWSQDAGITAQSHPSMAYVCLVNVAMAALPDGLLYDLPTQLQDIEITHTNLSALPDDLDKRWQHVASLYVEYAQLREWPRVLLRMTPFDFSLIGNAIQMVPSPLVTGDGDDDSNASGYFTLALANNPIERLPDSIGKLDDLLFLSLEHTRVRELPPWIETVRARGRRVFLYGTPFCQDKSADELERAFSAVAVVTCANVNPRMMGRYPYDEMVQQWWQE